MDDSCIRTLTASSLNQTDGIRADIIVRARVKACSVMQDILLAFPKKVFSIREDFWSAKVRLDKNDAVNFPIKPSESGNSCFLEEEEALVRGLLSSERMLVEVYLLRIGSTVFEFNVCGFNEAYRSILSKAIDADSNDLLEFNRRIVDSVFRFGPYNTKALVEVLQKKRLLKDGEIESAMRKGRVLFSAAQRFAEKSRASEIYGHLEGSRMNWPLSSIVHQNCSPELRALAQYISD